MKFLVSIHYFPPHIGGMETLVQKQAESLSAKGHEVTVLTCRHDAKLPLHEQAKGYAIRRLRALNFVETKLGMALPLVSPFLLIRMLKQVDDYDVIHIHDVYYPLSQLIFLAALIRKKPFYLTQHVAIVDHPSRLVRGVQSIIHKTIGKAMYKRAKSIVVYNVNVRKYLFDLGVDKTKIVLNHNGINTAFFAPATVNEAQKLRRKYCLPLDRPIVLFVGRLIPEKGYDLVFDCQSADYLTIIVGGGAVPKRMKNARHVHFFGSASQSELRDLYRLSNLFVFPAAVEIFALVMQEAMACGLPVITANNPHYRHYGLNNHLFRQIPRTKKALKSEVAFLLADPQLQRKMSDYSRALAVERFSWGRNYAHEYAIYDLRQTGWSVDTAPEAA
ncbi:MAG TPA: glycosyltransferase family 4 protein [Candidatus Saccharimonadales bacterium]